MTLSECSDDCAYDVDFLPRPEISQLPAAVKGRLNALKNLQLNTIKAESEYYQEIKQLDIKFQPKYDEINQQRAKVIDGSHEPSGSELEWHSEPEDEDVEALSEKVKDLAIHPDYPEGVKGIPKFWLHVFKNANEDVLMGCIEPHDEEVLAYMTDVTVSLRTDGFKLHFHFKENPFFTNQELTKDYTYREGPNPQSPLTYDGPEIAATKGCSIDWKEGKDLTKLTMKVEKITTTDDHCAPEVVPADSFFDFFDPPVVEDGELITSTLVADFEVGVSIKEQLIPRALLYFTGDIFNHQDDDDSETSDSEGEEESEGDVVILTGSRRSQKSKTSISK